ncbi:retrovirus-related pol polyprotein from transposon TNT 1-94 [Tanacetum coccineum]|uniref:Retrovirus-related pol polyprotein from transposon TNT 1-94 n=1 Tax=Tanacetum coccineum TaxID=301880 RepID=A0ABQ4XAA1_9ASTR
MSNPSTESSNPSPVKVDVPSELPKVSLVNESLKKLKSYLAKFDSIVKKGFHPLLLLKVNGEAAVQQYLVDKRCLEIANAQVLNENDRLLEQIISQDIVNIVVNSYVDINASVNEDVSKSNVHECNKCLKLETELLKKKYFIEKEIYDKLSRSYSTLEKHCISLEVATQLNQEIFQRDNSASNQNAPNFNQYIELNELKAQAQEKDTVIRKLKERIKSLSGNVNVENVKKDIDEIKTINIELEHSVAKLISENENLTKECEHLKSIFKDQFDSIKKKRVQSKEHSESLIAQIKAKSVENLDLNAQLQEKIFAITALKDDLRKLKGKSVVDYVVSKPNAIMIAPGMYKLDPVTLAPRDKNNRETHIYYLKHTMEQAAILREIVKQAKSLNPLDSAYYTSYKYVKQIQELLGYVRDTFLDIHKPSGKLVAVMPINKRKTVRFAKPITSSSTNQETQDSNKPLLHSTGVKCSTSASGSKPSGNTKNNRISFLGTVKFGNGQIAKIMGYGDYQIRNIIISRVYYMEGLGHNLFSVGQICESDFEVAFRKHMCFIHNLEGVDLLSGYRETNLYTLSIGDMMASSPICLLSKASKTKSWPMRVASVNGKKYILVIVDDYSRFTWVKFLASKDEAPYFIIKFLKIIQVRLNAIVRNIRTDNGTEFVNQTLHSYYESVVISHETYVARTPQQNSVVERRNRTLVEAA